MGTTVSYQTKLDRAVEEISREFGDDVVGIFVIGSITQEPTAASDCDVAVVFRDEAYTERLDEIRRRFRSIGGASNRTQPVPELVLWPTKEDHYRTTLPDVSYVRRNLPDEIDRLDAWCGLAKFTLLAYEGSASVRVYGDFDLPLNPAKIPPYECLELFLLSTRTLAEGLAELLSNDPAERRRGINHVAKAGLRAAYSATLRVDGVAHNSYREILDAALGQLPGEFHAVLRDLQAAKSGRRTEALDLGPVFSLFRYCETQIADTRRQQMSGLHWGRAGESFGFALDDLLGGRDDVAQYRRFPGFSTNYVHSLYFLMSARAIANRFISSKYTDADGLDLFFEELTTLATFGIYNPHGIRVLVGRTERSTVEIDIGIELLSGLVPMFTVLARQYLSGTEGSDSPWLSQRDKLLRLQTTLSALGTAPGIETPSDVSDGLSARLDGELDLDQIIDWQLPMFECLVSSSVVQAFTKFGLAFYQAGELGRARRLLERLVEVSELRQDAASELGLAADAFDRELSKAHHYLGITYQRQDETEPARQQYERALDLDPDNYSVLDDYAAFLLDNDPRDRVVALLRARVENCRTSRREAEEQISNRFHNHAIDLKRAGDLEGATFFYTQTVGIGPPSEKAHHNFGVLKEQSGEIEAAMKLYRKAIGINVDYVNSYVNLGVLLERQQRFPEAVELLSGARKRGIANEHALTNLGNCYLFLRDLEAAGRCYEEALAIDNGFANALGGKGSVLLHGEHGSEREVRLEAAECFRRAFEADPTFVDARIQYERLRAELGRG